MPLRPRLLTSSCIALAALMSVMATPSKAEAPQGEVRQSPPFTLSSGTARTPEQMAVRFDAANLAFDIQPETKTVQAHARLDFTATAPVAAIVLELDSRFSIDGIQVGDQDITYWSNPEGRMTIPLPRPLEAGESVSVNIAYGGAPHTATRAPWDGGWVWSESSGKPWIATAIQGEGCDLIWPCIDHPMGEPARVDMHITVPKGLSAPANGKLVGVQEHGDGSTTWHWTTRDPNTYAITLNVGPYQELSDQYQSRYGNSVPMAFWALDSVPREKAQGLFDQLPQMLAFFEEWVGPYPFADEKVGVVETPHLGMEHQTLNAYGNGYKLDGKGYDWLLQHELAHEWFGNQMTNVSWDDMWLHEGFGTYMQPLYARWLNGDRAMQAELETMRRTITNRFPMVSGRPQDAATVYKAETGPALDLYYKGALIAHTLRLYMGDEAFKQSLRELVYGTPEPQPGQITTQYRTTAHYITIVSALMAKDMSWFFDSYLYQAALPELVMEREGDVVRLSWKTPAKQPFIMPVEIEIDGTIYTVEMKDGSAVFSAPANAHILLDPHSKVLRHLPHIEAWKRETSRPARP